MYSIAKPFLLHAITSVHAGSGSENGIVDLPIQREKHTNYPKIESSSLKGALRSHFEMDPEVDESKLELVFGSKPDKNKENTDNENNTQASAIAFSDARLLLFPIRSLKGVFVWITCPQVINRFNDDLTAFTQDLSIEKLEVPKENTVSSDLMMVGGNKIVLEEYTFSVTIDEKTQKLAKQLEKLIGDALTVDLASRIVVLSDNDFANFVTFSTEVNARVKIGETGTVDSGALWYEENVPPETMFYSYLFIGNVRGNGTKDLSTSEQVQQFMKNHMPSVFQLGGNYTIGKGIMRTIWLERGDNDE
jgi:CRISPR-associated protein Cmr4